MAHSNSATSSLSSTFLPKLQGAATVLDNQDPFNDTSNMATTVPPGVGTRTDGRSKMSRSATAQTGTIPVVTSRERPRRTQSEDSGGMERSRDRTHHSKSKPTAAATGKKDKLPSAHADVIDKLDFSAGGMYHHDGPFDACAPSRNKQKNHRAPMFAFNGEGVPPNGTMPAPHNVPMLDKRLSPLAQATLTAMVSSPDSHGPYNAVGSGPYPSVASSRSQASPYAPLLSPRKTTLAEAWGKAEPEPFEEFSAGAGTIGRSPANSIDGGYEGYYRNQLPKSSSRQKDISRQLVDQETPRRPKLPPPQPIALPGTGGGSLPNSPTGSPVVDTFGGDMGSTPQRPAVVKRTKSLMQRIRKMRDSPNVPLGGNDSGYHEGWTPGATPVLPEEDYNYASEGPGYYRPSTSRKPSARRGSADDAYYSTDVPPLPQIPRSRDKALPPPPMPTPSMEDNTYFEQPKSPGIGRKTSLYRKVKGVVGGTKVK